MLNGKWQALETIDGSCAAVKLAALHEQAECLLSDLTLGEQLTSTISQLSQFEKGRFSEIAMQFSDRILRWQVLRIEQYFPNRKRQAERQPALY
jgi:hypothetical protein